MTFLVPFLSTILITKTGCDIKNLVRSSCRHFLIISSPASRGRPAFHSRSNTTHYRKRQNIQINMRRKYTNKWNSQKLNVVKYMNKSV